MAPSLARSGTGPRAWRWRSLRRDARPALLRGSQAGHRQPGQPRTGKTRNFSIGIWQRAILAPTETVLVVTTGAWGRGSGWGGGWGAAEYPTTHDGPPTESPSSARHSAEGKTLGDSLHIEKWDISANRNAPAHLRLLPSPPRMASCLQARGRRTTPGRTRKNQAPAFPSPGITGGEQKQPLGRGQKSLGRGDSAGGERRGPPALSADPEARQPGPHGSVRGG